MATMVGDKDGESKTNSQQCEDVVKYDDEARIGASTMLLWYSQRRPAQLVALGVRIYGARRRRCVPERFSRKSLNLNI